MIRQGPIYPRATCVLDILVLSSRNLATFGSPHQGVFGIPECEAEVPVALSFLLLWSTFTSGGKCPSVWAGAPIDLAWGVWALDPGLKFLWNSCNDSTGPCRPGTVLAWPLQPDPLPGRQQMILSFNFGFKRKNYSVRISLPGRLEQRARVKERDVQGGAGWPRKPGAGDVGRRHHHHTKGFPPANQVHM